MFTGIVEETGRVRRTEVTADVLRVEIEASLVLDGLLPGGSIAVNGCCLTAVEVGDGSFTAELTQETILRTAFEERLRPGRLLNLERPLRASGRFDGHIVQGHVDGTGEIRALRRDLRSASLEVTVPETFVRYLVEKGSVAVDGISLTVASVGSDFFVAALIPYTLDHTALREASPGARVNLEADVIAKYVERLMASRRGPDSE